MGVVVPDLDDRTYEELLEDVRKRLPVYAEEWTDHNAHDPGITVLELLTWLAESYRYQLDRIEDRHRRKYARLLGVTPAPPAPATAAVRVDPDPTVAGETVPAGTRLVADDGRTERAFETTRPTTLTGATIAKVVAVTPDGRTDHTPAALADGTYFHPFGETAAAGSTLYLGFDTDPFADATSLALTVDYHDTDLPSPGEHGQEPDAFEPFEPSVQLSWEYCTDFRVWEWSSAWQPFDVDEDTTDAFYKSGTVTLEHPDPGRWQGVDDHAPGVVEAGPGFAWIRVRLTTPGYEIPPRLDRLRTNVLQVAHRATETSAQLTRADGASETSARPHQRFEFDHAPVLDATVTVGGERWTRVADVDPYGPPEAGGAAEADAGSDAVADEAATGPTAGADFDASGPDDRHFVLDQAAGAIEFGDNVRGAVPEAGQAVEATSYTYGGGPEGNVPATSDWWFARPDATAPAPDWAAPPGVRDASVEPRGPASGGRAGEDIDDALDRLQRDLEEPYRAVTAADFEHVALHTPGLRFGRAKAVVSDGASPGDCVDHDAIRVVVVPYSPPAIARPTPSEGFLEAVGCHLDAHRLLTDRVSAVPPTYVGIGVRVEVELEPGSVPARRQAAVSDALDEFLSPLRGFDGEGWPFGRPVYDSELYERVAEVEGIDCVHDVDVTATGDATVVDGAVELPDTGLVAPTDHTVVVRETGRECEEVR